MTLELKALFYQRPDFHLSADYVFAPNGRYVLLAPSGSGKSTLLELMAGFLTPSRGQILYQGRNLCQEKVGKRPISYLFQNYNLFEHLSVERNLALVNARPNAIEEALHAVALPSAYLRKLPSALSGGEQQRVALARTFLQQRPIILLDEPFSALDPDTKDKICALTVQLQQQQSALLIAVSHDPNDVQRLAANALTIENHQLCDVSTQSDIRA